MQARKNLGRSKVLGRHTLMRAVVWLCGAILVTVSLGVPVRADPSVSDIEKQIEQGWNKLEPLIEDYNQVHGQLEEKRVMVAELAAKLEPLQAKIDRALEQVGKYASELYKGQDAATLNALVSGNPSELTSQLELLDRLASRQRADIASLETARDQYAEAKRPLDALLKTLAAQDADLAARKKSIDSQIANLQSLRHKVYGNNGEGGSLQPVVCPYDFLDTPGTHAAKKACSLIGKPYIWADAGPDGYDCSGLTLAAWATQGVHLRHFTGWQWVDNRPISRSQLRPGDLVFFFSDHHHVALYVGGGWIVQAPHVGDVVRMSRMDNSMPISGYRRVVG
jgi:cell wall-associated NlpC family hydrolase